MSFASHLFILVFLPLVILLYYRLFKTPRGKMYFLLAASLLFYSVAGWKFIPLLLALSALTFWGAKKGWFLPGILLNLGALALFKYLNFGLETFNALMRTLGLAYAAQLLQLGLPLGISFYVFKHIGYLLDIQNKRYPASEDLWAFLTFSAYFPQVSAGPISAYKDTAAQFAILPDRLENEQATAGLVHLSYGIAKKVLIADQIGLLLNSGINTAPNFPGLIPAWYMVIAFAVQLYFDFSGYTDMALGVSTLLGVKLPANFNNPYLARDASEFWDRWHMSLSTWFRYYLFSPMSRSFLKKWGSSRRELAQYAANLFTMSLVGLWHGSGWGYILWGAYHGILLNLNAWWKRTGREIPAWVTRPAVILGVLVGWALFMSPNWAYLRHILAGMIGKHGLGSLELMNTLWQHNATLALLAGIPLAFSGFAEAAALLAEGRGMAKWQMVAWGILVALALLMIQQQISFFYVQF